MKYLAIIAIILLPAFALAQGVYKPLVGIPGVNPDTDFDSYINALYAISISVAALLAVIKIIIAGVKWMMTDIVTSKSEAKKDIQGALLGLLIVLGAVLIITVINPDILKVDLSMEKATTPTAASGSAGGAVAPYSLNPGDQVVGINVIGATETDKKNFCETVNPSTCSSVQSTCYTGTYYPATTGQAGTCVVTSDKFVKGEDDFMCTSAGDCAAATQKCLNAGLVPVDDDCYISCTPSSIDSSTTEVQCNWP